MTLQHIVLFSFPRDLSRGRGRQMRDMVASWPAKIGLMTKCRFGTDLTGARTRGLRLSAVYRVPRRGDDGCATAPTRSTSGSLTG